MGQIGQHNLGSDAFQAVHTAHEDHAGHVGLVVAQGECRHLQHVASDHLRVQGVHLHMGPTQFDQAQQFVNFGDRSLGQGRQPGWASAVACHTHMTVMRQCHGGRHKPDMFVSHSAFVGRSGAAGRGIA